jgi:hypothetical protein
VRILHGFDCVFRGEPSHYQGELAIRCRLDRKPVDTQYVLRSVSAAAVYFHYKLDGFHDSFQILGQGFGLSSRRHASSVGLVLESLDPQPTSSSIHNSVSLFAEKETIFRQVNLEDMKEYEKSA